MRKKVRSWLFVPGHSEKMVGKAAGLAAEALIFDLQDAVPPGEKEAARGLVGRWLAGADRDEVYVRINPLDSGLGEADLEAVVRSELTGVVLPLAARLDQVQALAETLARLERVRGLATGAVAVVLQIESPAGVLNAPELACSPRVSALAFGGEDYALELGVERTPEGKELTFAQGMLANAAAAAGVAAVDTVYRDFRDDEGLARECAEVRSLGFTGKLAIHPAQIAVIHEAFRPAEAELSLARRVVEAFEEAGGGVVTVDGQMVDAPVVERARRILAMGEED
ncbi:MAG: aldolase/citrate lyase family protein [Thermoleophilia bacterium]